MLFRSCSGAFNLMNLCLRTTHSSRPASFLFSSSVSARQGIWTENVAEEITTTPEYAAATGYGRSKWIVENLCRRAAEERGLWAGVLRIGQMVGDTVQWVPTLTFVDRAQSLMLMQTAVYGTQRKQFHCCSEVLRWFTPFPISTM